MRTRVECTCGWQRELSEFYAGKRIRCPECAVVVDVPGESDRGLYNSPMPIHQKPQPERLSGCWVSTGNRCGTRCGGGVWIMIAVIVAISAVNVWRQIQADRALFDAEPALEESLQDPVQKPVEVRPDERSPAKPAPAPTPADDSATNEDEF